MTKKKIVQQTSVLNGQFRRLSFPGAFFPIGSILFWGVGLPLGIVLGLIFLFIGNARATPGKFGSANDLEIVTTYPQYLFAEQSANIVVTLTSNIPVTDTKILVEYLGPAMLSTKAGNSTLITMPRIDGGERRTFEVPIILEQPLPGWRPVFIPLRIHVWSFAPNLDRVQEFDLIAIPFLSGWVYKLIGVIVSAFVGVLPVVINELAKKQFVKAAEESASGEKPLERKI
ncbi:MAG: hypothetical protein HZA15_14625 [Nitrospirae bacterium]|nr:hypothetical protein [Nitrospirota bacterium]